jgi:hypothetical protein
MGREIIVVGTADVQRLRESINLFRDLGNRFGGGNTREALLCYLRSEAKPLLRGRYNLNVGRELRAAVAEGLLLAGWVTYDSGPTAVLAQRYFRQAAALASETAAPLLAARIHGAMSERNVFLGRYTKVVTIARSARAGIHGFPAPALTTYLCLMEARALAGKGDAKGCFAALSTAITEFDRGDPANEPSWMSFFDESALCAEVAHCMQDLGRPKDAIRYAEMNRCIRGNSAEPSFECGHFIVSFVLANALLATGEITEAECVARHASTAGARICSGRCETYAQRFRSQLPRTGARDRPAVATVSAAAVSCA